MSQSSNTDLLEQAYEALEGEVNQEKVEAISNAILTNDLEKLAWLLQTTTIGAN